MRLAVSESVRRALAGDPDWGSWFVDDENDRRRHDDGGDHRRLPHQQQRAPGAAAAGAADDAGVVDESFGRRRVEAAWTLQGVGDAKVRAAATEAAVGTALLLHLFERVAPREPLDYAFLAEAAVHAFSLPDVISHWSE